MQAVEITRDISPLQRQYWRFWFEDRNCVLWLDNYSFNERETTRHKFKSVEHYARLDARSNNIDLADVPLPEDVKDEAKAKLVERIAVKKWDRD